MIKHKDKPKYFPETGDIVLVTDAKPFVKGYCKIKVGDVGVVEHTSINGFYLDTINIEKRDPWYWRFLPCVHYYDVTVDKLGSVLFAEVFLHSNLGEI